MEPFDSATGLESAFGPAMDGIVRLGDGLDRIATEPALHRQSKRFRLESLDREPDIAPRMVRIQIPQKGSAFSQKSSIAYLEPTKSAAPQGSRGRCLPPLGRTHRTGPRKSLPASGNGTARLDEVGRNDPCLGSSYSRKRKPVDSLAQALESKPQFRCTQPRTQRTQRGSNHHLGSHQGLGL